MIYFDGEAEDIEFLRGIKKQQTGDGLGERMQNAIEVELKTSEKVLLTGSDLLGISAEFIQDAFRKLDEADVVIAPAADGGYGLIGMKKSHMIYQSCKKIHSIRNTIGCRNQKNKLFAAFLLMVHKKV